MSRQARVLIPVILAMVVLSGSPGCDNQNATVFPNSVFFVPPDPITMNIGDSRTVFATVLPFSSGGGTTDLGTTVYSSSNASVATVDANSGKVTCVSPGTVAITATNTNKAGSSKATLQVTCVTTTPLPPAGAILTVTPPSISFSHTVGTTSCPESIGPLHLVTTRNETVSVILAVSGTSALTLGQTSVTLPALGSADVPVDFNCSTQTNFTANIILNATSATTSATVTVPVTSAIK
jgi:large repetitive protein